MDALSLDRKQFELINCNFVKTVLMLLVVLYHSCVFWTGSWFNILAPSGNSAVLELFSKWLNSFHIYGFALVSGYIFYYIKYEKEKYNGLLPFLVNKANACLFHMCLFRYIGSFL